MAVIKIVPMPGAVGEKGDEGAVGPQGQQGPAGQNGLPGTPALWSYQGTWNSSAAYAVGDVVVYQGQLYYTKSVTTAGTLPTVTAKFDLIASKGADGTNGTNGTNGAPGTNGTDGKDSLFLGTWNSVTEFLAAYQGGPTGLADGDWWAFVKDNTDPNKIYVVREDPLSATGWVIDNNESFVLPAGTNGSNGAGFGIFYLGNYNPSSGYVPDIAVVRGSDGQLYLAKASGQLSDPVGNTAQWEVWIPKGQDGEPGTNGANALWNYTGEYNGGASYAVGDVATYDGQLWYRYNSNGGNVGDIPSPGLWNLLAAKGSDGGLTYWDGTGNPGTPTNPGIAIINGIATPIGGSMLVSASDKVWLSANNGEFLNDPTVPANQIATIGDIAKTNGSWTVTTGTNTYNFTLPSEGTYTMWVNGNIPNGIILWNATVSVSNSNVPAIGSQYAWNYTSGGSPILITAIPNQIRGVAGTINTDATYMGNTSNRFDFTIANTSGASVTVYYGYTKI